MLRPPYAADDRRSLAMNAGSDGPAALPSSRRACASSRRSASSRSSLPSLALATAAFNTVMVLS